MKVNGTATPQKISKKEARQLIYNKLSDALSEFKPLIKKKKFDSKMLKVTKLFAADIISGTKKIEKKKKDPVKKKATKPENEPVAS